jgi:RNA polymerase sigma factor (sigma-70 family)
MLRDPQLLLAYRHGSEEAFLALYERYSSPLRRFLQGGFSFSSQGRQCRFRGTDTSMDVESLVQETFARAFAKTTRENYDGVRPFQTYLFSIAKNLVLRECHHRDRLVVVDYMEDNADGQSVFSSPHDNGGADSPEQRVANKLEGIMSTFIDELSVEERRLFALRFAKGFTQEASADMMKTTRARVKLLEKNIRKRFLDRLKENGYFTGYVPNPRWKRQQQGEDVAQAS